MADSDSSNRPGPPDDATRTSDGTTPLDSAGGPLPAAIGHFRILGVLGMGGMGVVYEAEQENPRRKVAVKVVRGGQFVTPERVKSFQREADTLALLKHPNIAAIYESGCTDDGQHFFAMELVSGQTLDRYLRSRPPVESSSELRLRLALFRRIADAAHYAHQRGVIHRDLKPSNVIVTADVQADDPMFSRISVTRERVPGIKILDFGLARITDSDIAAATMVTEVGVIKGTLPYMSPEQTRGDSQLIDVRSDVYALGVMLYEMIAGTLPYKVVGLSIVEAVRVICEQAAAPISTARSGIAKIDVDVETIVGKALEKDVERRYSSAAALSEDVSRYLESQPILARPPSTAYQLRKFAERNRVLVGGVAATFLMLIVAVIGTGWGWVRAREERARAEHESESLAAVNRFLNVDLLGSVSPEEMGRDVKMRDVLDAAAARIEGRFADAPGVEAQLRQTLGSTYRSLGTLTEAEGHFRRAIELRTAETGPEDLEVLRLRTELGDLLTALSRFDEAEATLLDVERLAAGHHAGNLELSSEIQRCLGWLYVSLRRTDEAEAKLRVAVAQSAQAFGDDAVETLDPLNQLAILLSRTGRHQEAIEIYEKAYAIDLAMYGEDHPKTIHTAQNRAQAYVRNDEAEKALVLLRDVLERSRRVFGNEHGTTITAINNMAQLYSTTGEVDQAEALYLEAIALTERVNGEMHAATATAVNNLGQMYRRVGRVEDALEQFYRVMRIKLEVFGEDNMEAMFGRAYVADVLIQIGRHAEARPILAALVASGERGLPEGHWYLGDFHMRHGIALRGLGRRAEAERELLAGHAILVASKDTRAGRAEQCAGELATLYREWGRPEEAESWSVKASPSAGAS